MPDKKLLIIEKAVELFAKNGFETTSVQEITEACGISKGAFYLYFKSKESLLFCIFELFIDRVSKKITSVFDMDSSPKEKLKLFLCIQFEEIDQYSDFILMLLREQTKPDDRELFILMKEMDKQLNDALKALLVEAYGSTIQSHVPDMTVIIKGIIKGYVELIIMYNKKFDFKKLATFLLARIDSLAAGLTTPYLEEEFLVNIENKKTT
ncbi:TetR/AcrR family transcriptional regulator [Psychrobacillus sp. NPDC058041]|uniref:TetR/AcrR family transcriptional regulator n=1 Tax=Psychrobacillus sp. NPDC058041 TaxID=3346310 RepID=UPI0036D9C1FD